MEWIHFPRIRIFVEKRFHGLFSKKKRSKSGGVPSFLRREHVLAVIFLPSGQPTALDPYHEITWLLKIERIFCPRKLFSGSISSLEKSLQKNRSIFCLKNWSCDRRNVRWGGVFLERTWILSGIQFTTYFIEIFVVKTKRFVGSFVHVILTRQTCSQRSSRAAESKRRALGNWFPERICYTFLISKCRGDWNLGLCTTSVLAFGEPQRNGKIRFLYVKTGFFFGDQKNKYIYIFKGGPEPSILDDFCLGNVISKYFSKQRFGTS